MLRSFENLRLGYKLFIPLTVVAVTMGVILWTARAGLNEVRAAGEAAINDTFARQTAMLNIANGVSSATIEEKSILLDADVVQINAARARYEAGMANALAATDRLIVLVATPERQARSRVFKAMITDFKTEADKSIALALRGERGAAVDASNSGVNKARLKVLTYTQDRIKLQDQEIEKTRLALVKLGNSALMRLYLFASIGLTASMVLFAGIVVLLVVRPFAAIAGSMRRLAEGDLEIEVVGAHRRDEVGSLAKSLVVFKANGLRAKLLAGEIEAAQAAAATERARVQAAQAREAEEDQVAITALAKALDALAHGKLDYQITESLAPKTQRLKSDFNATAIRLRETIGTIAGAINGMTTATGEISHAAADLSRRTEQQAASLEETAAALDQVTATVRKTADGAKNVQGLITTARGDAEHSSGVVRDAKAAMNEIEQSAQQVSQIIGVIDEIAFQTNLLALNAGVEAARAGDAGRGFAVVASEVRALAQRSAQAAKEIKQLISTSSSQVERGVKLVEETGGSLQRIAGHVGQVYVAINEIADAAKEQATGLQQVNTAINQMDQVTQQNAAMVEQSTAASQGLANETAELSRLTSYFTLAA